MIWSLIFISGLLILIGLFGFIKKKPAIGWLFLLAGMVGIVIALVVISIYPDKI